MDGRRPVPRSTIPRPSSSRKKVRVMTVIAASRCSRRLTVNEPSVLAPLDEMGGQRARLLGQLLGDVVLLVQLLELLVVVGPVSRSRGRSRGACGPSPSMSWTIGGKTCRVRKIERRQGDHVDDQDREHPRHLPVARPGALDQARRRGRARAPGRSRRPPTAGSSAYAGSRSPAAPRRAIQKSATSTTFATARASIPSARIGRTLNSGPDPTSAAALRYSARTSMTHRLDSLALLLLLPLRGE